MEVAVLDTIFPQVEMVNGIAHGASKFVQLLNALPRQTSSTFAPLLSLSFWSVRKKWAPQDPAISR